MLQNNQHHQYYINSINTQQKRQVLKFSQIIQDYSILVSQYHQALDTIENLKNQNTQLKAIGKGGVQIVKNQEKQIKALKKDNENLEEQLSEKDQILKLTLQKSDLERANAKLEKRIHNKSLQFQQLESVLQIKEQKLGDIEQQAIKLRGQNDMLQELKISLQKKLENATLQNADLINRILKMKEEQVLKMNEANQIYDEALSFKRTSMMMIEQSKIDAERGNSLLFDMEQSTEDLNLNYFFKTNEKGGIPTSSRAFINAHEGGVNAVSFFSNGDTVMTGGADKLVKYWSANKSCESAAKTLKGLISPVTSVSQNLQNSRAFATSTQRSAKIWNTKTERVAFTLSGHTDVIHEGKICYHKSAAATGSADRTVRIWDINKGTGKKTCQALSQCRSIDIDCCDSMVVSGHLNGSVIVWQIDSGEKIKEWKDLHDESITSVRFSYDRNYILVNSRDNTLKYVDMRSDKNIIVMKDEMYSNGFQYNRASISSGDKYAVVGSSLGHILFFNLLDGKIEEINQNAHNCRIQSVHWQPRGNMLASVDQYGGLIIWE